jgi:PAB-dependent poly(A)-specific ribonuclease subunit 2
MEEYYEEYTEEAGHGDHEEAAWGFGEIAVAPIFHGDAVDFATALRFDAAEEVLWAGTNAGVIAQSLCPDLQRFAEVAAHHDGIISMRSAGNSCVSLSPSQLSLHFSGCVPRIWFVDEIGDLAALEFEPRGHRVLLGRSGGGITSFDLVTGRTGGTIDTLGQGVVSLCGPLPRGAVVMGTVEGKIALLDARNNLRQEASLTAHSGGFAAIDASGDLIATAGYTGKMGRISLEPTVKVFDVRMGLRMLSNLPFAAGPTLLRFHPTAYSESGSASTLLIGSDSGMFTLTDAGGLGVGEMYGVDSGGDPLISCDISPSGEIIAFGGAGGYIHLWAGSEAPSTIYGGEIPTTPVVPEGQPPSLQESDPLGLIELHYPPDNTGYASDIGPRETMAVGLAPRTLDATLMASSKQSDFVTHIENPRLVRGGLPGQSAAAVAILRNTRIKPRPGLEDAEASRAERAAARAAAGGVILPGRYRKAVIKQQTGIKFEEFDFSYYNKTPFSGLENDLANCYVNALLQVLFFCRPMRDLAMTHTPDPDIEFSLIGELSLLFRMLATSGGIVCQAANLLRALRQSKEALALGLLEGVRGERGSTDIEVEAQKDKSLARRAQRLSRFIMEQLSKEASAIHTTTSGLSSITNKHTGAASEGILRQQHQNREMQQVQMQSPLEEIFAISQHQRTRCLSRQRPDQDKTTRAFQVDLQYPSPKDRPPLSSSHSKPSSTNYSTSNGSTLSPMKADAAATDAADGAAFPRPSFADVLAASLHTVSDMRAWFDEVVSYQLVRQERCPTNLPQVLVVNCGLEDRGDLAWWQPVTNTGHDDDDTTTNTNISIAVHDEDSGGRGNADGNDVGVNTRLYSNFPTSPRTGKSRAWLPMSVAITVNPEDWSVDVIEGASSAELATKRAETQQKGGPLPAAAVRAVYELTAVVAHVVDEDEAAEGGPEYEGHLVAHINVPRTYYSAQQESPIMSRSSSTGPEQQQQKVDESGYNGKLVVYDDTLRSPLNQHTLNEGEVKVGDDRPSTPAGAVTATAFPGTPSAGFTAANNRRNWMLFNDFRIAPCLPEDVTEIYAGQKVPVLLFFTRIEELSLAAVEPPAPPTPVLTPENFLSLCRAPPIQLNKTRLNRPTFVPFSPEEVPRPGQVFALDAEFVQYSPPERIVRRGIEVEARPPRLGLGRVSVVRGQGPGFGVTCIDDYIRSVEPVYDYLTRFSGLIPGDLDPTQSRNYLTTLRRAYLKLRYLVDSGAVFVGHGLKKDFRMLNIVIPPEQVIDTVDLFHSGRRRLSLRFLAAYLLGATIQSRSHDSVEDAVAALKLYDKYKKLKEEGKFEETLAEIFDWGNAHGFDPAAWKAVPPHLAAQIQAKQQEQQEQATRQQEAAAAAAARHVQHLQVLQHQLIEQQRKQQVTAALQQQYHYQNQQQQQQQKSNRPPGL